MTITDDGEFGRLRFWLPLGACEQELFVLPENVEPHILRPAQHEAGHIIVAHHYGARVIGIGVGFKPELGQGIFPTSFYETRDWRVETSCIVKAAGCAADLLHHGAFSEQDASGDLLDIEALTGIRSLEPYLTEAKRVLSEYPTQLECISAALRDSIAHVRERTFSLVGHKWCALFLDESQLMNCLAPREPA